MNESNKSRELFINYFFARGTFKYNRSLSMIWQSMTEKQKPLKNLNIILSLFIASFDRKTKTFNSNSNIVWHTNAFTSGSRSKWLRTQSIQIVYTCSIMNWFSVFISQLNLNVVVNSIVSISVIYIIGRIFQTHWNEWGSKRTMRLQTVPYIYLHV